MPGAEAPPGAPRSLGGVDAATVHRRLVEARVGRLATVTPDRRPHVVPCCFVLAGVGTGVGAGSDVDTATGSGRPPELGTVYSAVDAKPKSTLALRRLANLRANPAASLLVDHYDEDWTSLWWIRADGRARVLDAGAERDDALVLLSGKYPQYRRHPPPGPVVALDVTTHRAWP